ncbi:MAG: NUDIX hydrolase [Salibacteraceae bacterium]
MYKVFLYDKALILGLESTFSAHLEGLEKIPYQGPDTFKEAHRLLERTKGIRTLLIFGENPKKMWKAFKASYKYLKAAGGVVRSSNNSRLFIFRRGCWDLPKGKIEPGEKKKVAAIREVEEECGISGLSIIRKLPSTFHIYPQGGRLVLKRTYWYEMETDFTGELTPQIEEDITEVRWLAPSEWSMVYANTFPSIVELMREINPE